MKTIEEMIFEIRFPNEKFNANDFNDWAKENEIEAYSICLTIAKKLQHRLRQLQRPITDRDIRSLKGGR
jgi:hypothetical protein